LAENVRIIASLGRAPTGPVVISKKLKPEQKEQFRNIFLHMHEDPEVFKALQDLVIDRFVIPMPAMYDPLRKLYDQTRIIL
jgi:phosphonate transport system substrate-binding protein